MSRDPKSREGALRQYRALYRQLRRDWGPCTFGMDWRTMAINAPDKTARLRQLYDWCDTLPTRVQVQP